MRKSKTANKETGRILRWESQSAPQNATSVFGDPAELDRWREKRVESRRYLAQGCARARQPIEGRGRGDRQEGGGQKGEAGREMTEEKR
jgi:hypothetical protein